MIRFALQGPARPQAAHRPDGARDRPRRRDGERHLRAHRLDREAFDAIFQSTYQNTDAVVTGKSAFNLGDNGTDQDPSFDESVLQKVRDVPERRRRRSAASRAMRT